MSDKMRTYLFSYAHDGARWQFEILASSPSDARARVKKLDLAEYDGELIAKVPTQIGWIAKFLVWAQNFLRDR